MLPLTLWLPLHYLAVGLVVSPQASSSGSGLILLSVLGLSVLALALPTLFRGIVRVRESRLPATPAATRLPALPAVPLPCAPGTPGTVRARAPSGAAAALM